MQCRFCNSELKDLFISLGSSPLANSYITHEQLMKKEVAYPLDVYVCKNCFLVQLPEFENPENIFNDYAYFSSYSDTWLKHAEDYVEKITSQFKINDKSFVIEIASNDGYLLQYFLKKNISVLGIEPARNVAEVARQKGIPTEVFFFGKITAEKLAKDNKYADLLIGNNVLAHVPNLNDFIKGIKIILKPQGICTLEFPYLMKLMEEIQFDTIYHEHFSYFSFLTVEKIFVAAGLAIFDVEELSTHGGSLRIYIKHGENRGKKISPNVSRLKNKELNAGYDDIKHYLGFEKKAQEVKQKILQMLGSIKTHGKSVVGYGAPAKGNTLLNYCGITKEFIDYTVDRSPHKQGLFLPGSHIPIKPVENIKETKPDYVFILPWNLKEEIMKQNNYIRKWGGKFVIPIPEVTVI